MALPIKGKRNRLTRHDLVDYLGQEHLSVADKVLNKMIKRFAQVQKGWRQLIDKSFLSQTNKEKYKQLVQKRYERLFG